MITEVTKKGHQSMGLMDGDFTICRGQNWTNREIHRIGLFRLQINPAWEICKEDLAKEHLHLLA
jgi:hypothetical protein